MTKPILFLNKLILEVYPCSLYVYKAPLPPKINAYLNYFTPDLPLESRLSFFTSLFSFPPLFTHLLYKTFQQKYNYTRPFKHPTPFFIQLSCIIPTFYSQKIFAIPLPPATLPLLPTHKFASQWSNIMKSQQKFVAMR